MLYALHTRGKQAEHAVSKKLEAQGFSWIIRSYASHGPIDLLCSNGKELLAVQVKSTKRPYLNEVEIQELRDWA
ncbi:MAG: restriction endonuclease, partial [Rhabdochlamydiaceae bacterium]